MKQAIKGTAKQRGALLLLPLLMTGMALSAPPKAAAQTETCGGSFGWSYGEPFYVGDVWSITATAICADGSTLQITGPVDPITGAGLGDGPYDIQEGFVYDGDPNREMDDE